MNIAMKWSILPIALAITGSLAMAQSHVPAEQAPSSSANSAISTSPDPTAGQRKESQQDRAPNGVRSGQLTATENSSMESEETPINWAPNADRSANGGNVTLMATDGVSKSINDLSSAFANRDLVAIRQLWPSIPEKPLAAMEKSFAYFKITSRNFRPENIDVNGDTAAVVGSYSGSFIKGTTNIPSNGKFHATLKKVGTRWILATLVCE